MQVRILPSLPTHMAQHEREVESLRKALFNVGVEILHYRFNAHIRIKIRHKQQVGNITLSASPSDFNVMRQRERQIRKELKNIGVSDPYVFQWRKV